MLDFKKYIHCKNTLSLRVYKGTEVSINIPLNLEKEVVLTQNFMLPITKKFLEINFSVYQVFLIKIFRKFFCLYIYPHYIEMDPIQEECYEKYLALQIIGA